MSSELKTEICIVGGGPAGTTIARRLALLGHEVCLLEGESFPRSHIGESLSPGILPLFDALDIRERIEEAGFYRPRQAFVKWGESKTQIKEFTDEPGFQVERGRFDQILLGAAREVGVKILQPARAGKPARTKNEKWLIPARVGKKQLNIFADFLIDAAGRSSLLGGRKKRLSPAMTAVYAYWQNAEFSGFESRVEAGQQEWFWSAPLPDGTINAAVFFDLERFRREKIQSAKLRDFYCSLLKQSELLRGCLKGRLISRVRVCDASSYLSEDFITPHSIKVGESAYAIDPLSSQGVQTAIRSGLQGSVVVHTLLTKPDDRASALQFYKERVSESAFFHERQANKFYVEAGETLTSDFWRKRVESKIERLEPDVKPEKLNSDFSRQLALSNQLKPSPQVKLVLTPCLTGDTIQKMPALFHHSLSRPTAFVDGVPVGVLWRLTSSKRTVAEILKEGELFIPREKLLKIIGWMVNSKILIASNEF